MSPGDVLEGLDAGTAHYSVSLDAPNSTADDDDPEPLGDSIGADDDSYGLIETTASLSASVAMLPYLERQALVLRLHSDMKQTEIARELDCSQMQVSRLLRRAAARLRQMTDPELEDRCRNRLGPSSRLGLLGPARPAQSPPARGWPTGRTFCAAARACRGRSGSRRRSARWGAGPGTGITSPSHSRIGWATGAEF